MLEDKYRKCSKCGSYANASSKYCRICGSKLSPRKDKHDAIVKIRLKHKFIPLIICICLVLLIILGLVLFIHK